MNHEMMLRAAMTDVAEVWEGRRRESGILLGIVDDEGTFLPAASSKAGLLGLQNREMNRPCRGVLVIIGCSVCRLDWKAGVPPMASAIFRWQYAEDKQREI